VPHWALIVVAFASLTSQEIEHGGVRIETTVSGTVYTWRITNVDVSPITGIELEARSSFDHRAPERWIIESEGSRVRAWTNDPRLAIEPGESGSIGLSVSSVGAVLGTTTVSLETAAEGETIAVPGVWTPVAKPKSVIRLVAATTVGLALLHALLITIRRGRQGASADRA
jgi:hypothetical protein